MNSEGRRKTLAFCEGGLRLGSKVARCIRATLRLEKEVRPQAGLSLPAQTWLQAYRKWAEAVNPFFGKNC